jgi:2-hydroxychromene-2-carboxylate isomerase
MGQLIQLSERRRAHAPQPSARPALPVFFFDVSCPLSYLIAERVERKLGTVEWVAASRAALRHTQLREAPAAGTAAEPTAVEVLAPDEEAVLRNRAEAGARALRLPLVWPDSFPSGAPCAQRAAAFACELGAGGAFALAASRLAFCGGFDLDDPETLAEAAAAAGMPLEECLAAAGETWRDEELARTAFELARHGVGELPAIRIEDRWFQGETGLIAAESLVLGAGSQRRAPMPPA